MVHFRSPISYREDINGLRAWAVVSVLLFHFQIPGFGAGFMGVDLFFVISGYLMTAIVIRGLEKQGFSLIKFYMARIRRIMPALLALLGALLILGWFWLPTAEYQQLGTQSAYSLAFLSNILFWRSTDYFAAAAQDKWLLHTWTLGVEFQFYILYPIFLLVLWRVKPAINTLFWGVVGAFIVSLLLSIVASGSQPVASFYLLPTRGWEFLAGGLSLLLVRQFPYIQRYAREMLWAGLGFWLAALAVLNNQYAWPSGWALLPTLSASLVIMAQQENSLLTANSLTSWLGSRSYSLYLWHWPIVVALHFVGVQQEPFWIIVGIGLSVLLADLSYRLVEIPTRLQLVKLSPLKEMAGFVLFSSILLSVSYAVIKGNFSNRVSQKAELAANESINFNAEVRENCRYTAYGKGLRECSFGKNIDAILIGDSHSEMIASALEISLSKTNKGFLFLGPAHGCPTLKDVGAGRKSHCKEYYRLVVQRISDIASDVPLIVYTSDWSGLFNTVASYEEALEVTMCELATISDRVIISRPVPSMEYNVPSKVARSLILWGDFDEVKFPVSNYHEKNRAVWGVQDRVAEKCGVEIVNPLLFLCDKGYCYGSKDGRPLYYDSGHLSEYGNKYLVPMFEQLFQQRGI